MAAYGIVLFYPASPIADELMLLHVLTQQVVFRAGLARSKAVSVTGATAETVFSLKHDNTEKATITFAAGQSVGTFTAAADFTIPVGGKFTVHAPATADATLADISITVEGEVLSNRIACKFRAVPVLEGRISNIPRCRVIMSKTTRLVGRLTNA
jgi:hypothetical protein